MTKKHRLVVVLVSLAMIAGAMLFLWLRDEELTPAARAVLSARAPDIPEQQNAYFLLLGLATPAGGDPLATARTLLDEQRARLAMPRGKRKEQHEKNTSFSVPKEFSRQFCDGSTDGCLPKYQRAEPEILKAVADNPVLVQRCESLYDCANFADVSMPTLDDLLTPSFNIAVSCARLTHALAAIDIKNGRTAHVVSRLARDNNFWRMLLARSNTLIAKMVAVATLQLRARMLSEVISVETVVKAGDASQLTDLTRPLTAAELNLGSVWLWESSASTRMLSELDSAALRQMQEPESNGPETWLILGGYRRNATINVFVHRYDQISAFFRNKPAFIVAHRDTFAAQVESAPTGNALYNPVGKMIAGLGMPQFADYALSVHDLDALIRLVRLKQQIVGQELADADVQAFLDRSDASLFDPYTERSMKWDAERRVLWSSAHAEKQAPSQRIEVAL